MNGSKNYGTVTRWNTTKQEEYKVLLPFASAWLDLESIMLSEIRQAVKDKSHMSSPISGTSSTKQISKQNRTRNSEIKNKLTVTKGEVGRDKAGKRGKGFQEHVQRTHGQKQRG